MFASKTAAARAKADRAAPARQPASGPTLRRAIGNQSTLRRAALRLGPATIQRQLAIGRTDDPLEHEADRAADQVMRMPEPDAVPGGAPQQVSRKCAACEEEASGMLSPKRADVAGHEAEQAPDSVHAALHGPGQPLDAASRAFFEPRFGRDFSAIRVHTDAVAARSAREIGARAYTVGNQIAFADNEWSPGQPASRHLLAHELAHAVQQNAAPQVRRQPQGAAPAPPSPQQVIETARAVAWGRTFNALQKLQGIGPPPPPGRADPGVEQQLQARRLAIQLFGWDPPNMDQITEIVRQMMYALTPGIKTTIAPASDPQCGNRAGYVVDHTPPIVLCPAFFSSSAEEQARTMVHEAAHIAGIGTPSGESYCGIYDCQTNCGGFTAADTWSHYIHCLSGQTPDKPITVTAPGGTGPGGGAKP